MHCVKRCVSNHI